MPCKFKQLLEKLSHEKTPGPSPAFSVLHLVAAMELIAQTPVGRSKLAEKLGIGEGSVRTIVGRLESARLIDVSRVGCSLTPKGKGLWTEYTSVVRKLQVSESELSTADHTFVALVRNHGHKVKSGMEQRDAAIAMEAKSITTMVFRKGHLVIPSVTMDVAKDFPKAADQIMHSLAPSENDAVVVGSANSPRRAEYGVLAAAWTLLDE